MTALHPIRKAVIPAAGKGTRMFPLTISTPKELLLIAGKPVIQYVVEEAVDSGIEDIILVLHPSKNRIRSFFENNGWSKKVQIRFIYQNQRKGLGDAILHAKNLVGQSPFVIMLGDNIVETKEQPLTAQLCQLYKTLDASVVALEEVPGDLVNRYGIVSPEEYPFKGVCKLKDVVEKPSPEEAPSKLAFASRYVFTPDIFSRLEEVSPGYNNELQLTDAIRLLLKNQPVYGYQFEGSRLDIGNPDDYERVKKIFGDHQ